MTVKQYVSGHSLEQITPCKEKQRSPADSLWLAEVSNVQVSPLFFLFLHAASWCSCHTGASEELVHCQGNIKHPDRNTKNNEQCDHLSNNFLGLKKKNRKKGDGSSMLKFEQYRPSSDERTWGVYCIDRRLLLWGAVFKGKRIQSLTRAEQLKNIYTREQPNQLTSLKYSNASERTWEFWVSEVLTES